MAKERTDPSLHPWKVTIARPFMKGGEPGPVRGLGLFHTINFCSSRGFCTAKKRINLLSHSLTQCPCLHRHIRRWPCEGYCIRGRSLVFYTDRKSWISDRADFTHSPPRHIAVYSRLIRTVSPLFPKIISRI